MTRRGDLAHALGLEVGHGLRTALSIRTLRLRAGQVTTLLGPGGSGKSTLLRLLGGVTLQPTDFWQRGMLLVADLPCALVSQRAGTDSLADRGLDRDALVRLWPRAPAVVELLATVSTARGNALPRGAERLVAVTLALAQQPGVLLLDEPEVDLSPELEAALVARIRSFGGTVVCATHNLRFARAISDEAVLLVHGELVECGPADRFFTSPSHPRTRHFIRMGG